jgi:hypothetical protein
MKRPHELAFADLAKIVARLQQLLYLEEHDGREVWNLDKGWASVDILVELADLLGHYDLIP